MRCLICPAASFFVLSSHAEALSCEASLSFDDEACQSDAPVLLQRSSLGSVKNISEEKRVEPEERNQGSADGSKHVSSLLLRLQSLVQKGLDKVHGSQVPAEHRLSPWQVEWSMLLLISCTVLARNTKGMQAIGAINAWLLASIGMNIYNKQASHDFPATCLLVIIQMLITNVTIIALRWNDLHRPVWRDFIRWLPVPCIVAAMLGSSLFALKGTTVSSVLILRNVLPIFTFGLEKTLLNNPPVVSVGHWMSMMVTLVGTAVYGMSNMSVTASTIWIILFSCVITVMDKLLQRFLLTSSDFKQSLAVCMLMNNTIGMIPLFFFALANGELWTWQSTLESCSSDTWQLVIATGLTGCSLGYFGLAVQKQISAVSVLMLQNASKVIIIWVGVLVFGDDISGISALGCGISMLGAAWYGNEAIKAAPPKAAEPEITPDVKK